MLLAWVKNNVHRQKDTCSHCEITDWFVVCIFSRKNPPLENLTYFIFWNFLLLFFTSFFCLQSNPYLYICLPAAVLMHYFLPSSLRPWVRAADSCWTVPVRGLEYWNCSLSVALLEDMTLHLRPLSKQTPSAPLLQVHSGQGEALVKKLYKK